MVRTGGERSGRCRAAVSKRNAARGELHAATWAPPVAGERGQARDGAHRHAAARVALQPVVDADERRPCRTILARERADGLRGQPRDGPGALRRPLFQPRAQLVVAQGVARDVVRVHQLLGHQHVHHGERQRGVGAGANGEPLVALLGRARADGVDGDDAGAVGPRAQHERPQVRVAGERVGAPQQHQVALGQPLAVGAQVGAHGHAHAHRAGLGADGARQLRGPERVEEAPIHGAALHQPHRAGIGVGQDGLRPVCRGGDGAQPVGDLVERLVPGDASEPAAALGTHAPHGMEQPLRVIGTLQVPVHLGAEEAGGERVGRVAGHANRPTALHGDQRGAGIRAVVRTGTSHHAIGGWGVQERGHGEHARRRVRAPANDGDGSGSRHARGVRLVTQGRVCCVESACGPATCHS